jgi:hypothetical protein
MEVYMTAREERFCRLCKMKFQEQDGFRIFWTGNDGHAYCSPNHALEGGGDPDKIKKQSTAIDKSGERP